MTLTHIEGVEIIERQPATAMAGSIAEGATISAVEQLLLADGRTVFHCIHKNAVDCEYINTVLGGVTSHQRTHSDRMEAKRATAKAEELAAQLAEIEAEKRRKRENYRQGAIKGQETRRAKQAQAPSEVGGVGNGTAKPGTVSKSVIGDADLAKKAQQVIIAYNALQDAHDQFQNTFLGYMRAAQVVTDKPAIDPQIVAKAAQYDIIQSALKGIK
jgi:hypothetical protein